MVRGLLLLLLFLIVLLIVDCSFDCLIVLVIVFVFRKSRGNLWQRKYRLKRKERVRKQNDIVRANEQRASNLNYIQHFVNKTNGLEVEFKRHFACDMTVKLSPF